VKRLIVRLGGMMERKRPLLKIFLFVYGLLSTLIYGSVLVGLYAHDDLTIIRADISFRHSLGDLNLLLLIFFGVSVMLSPLKGKFWGTLSLLLAFAIASLMAYINFAESHGITGLLVGLACAVILLFLPSCCILISGAEANSGYAARKSIG
jgi:hypothetical protein